MSQRQEKEKELKVLVMLEKHIDVAIKRTEIRLKILTLAGESCLRKQEPLKAELRVR